MSPANTPETRSRLWLVLLPVILFAGLAALFWKGLSLVPRTRRACRGSAP